MRVRMAVGTIGATSGALTSSNVASGEDMDRTFGLRGSPGDGVGEGAGETDGCRKRSSGGCVWLRVGVLRVFAPSFSAVPSVAALFARRARRSFKLGFEA